MQREETIGTSLLQWSHAFGQHQIFQSQFGCSNVPPPLPFQSLFFSFHSSPAATTEPRKKKKKKNLYFPLNTGWLIGILTMVYSMAPDVNKQVFFSLLNWNNWTPMDRFLISNRIHFCWGLDEVPLHLDLYIHIPRAPMTFIFEGQPLKHCLFQAKQGSFGF